MYIVYIRTHTYVTHMSVCVYVYFSPLLCIWYFSRKSSMDLISELFVTAMNENTVLREKESLIRDLGIN